MALGEWPGYDVAMFRTRPVPATTQEGPMLGLLLEPYEMRLCTCGSALGCTRHPETWDSLTTNRTSPTDDHEHEWCSMGLGPCSDTWKGV